MISLCTNITNNYLKTGTKPRLFCEVVNSSNEQIALISCKNDGVFSDNAKSFNTISGSIEPYGGMAEKTGVNVEGYLLGTRLALCDESTLNPLIDTATGMLGAGKSMSQGAVGVSYADVRNATTGIVTTVGIVIGRQKVTTEDGVIYYRDQRGYLQFKLPSGINTCEEAVFEFNGQADYSATDFYVELYEGTWTNIGTGIFNDFDGWAASGAYTGTVLNEEWNTSGYSGTVKNKIRLNEAGRQYIVDNSGNIVRFAILSKNTVDNASAPTGNEFVQFEASTAQFKIRYNSQTLDNQEARLYLGYDDGTLTTPVTLSALQRVFTGVVDDFTITPEIITLNLKQNDFKKDVLIPKNLISQDDFTEILDDNLIGTPYPVIYGDFDTAKVHKNHIPYFTSGDGLKEYWKKDYVKAWVYYNDESGIAKFAITNHPLKSIGTYAVLSEGDNFALYPCTLAGIAGYDNKRGEISIASGDASYFPYSLAYTLGGSGESDTISPIMGFIPLYGYSTGTEDYNCVDSNTENYMELDSSVYHTQSVTFQFYNDTIYKELVPSNGEEIIISFYAERVGGGSFSGFHFIYTAGSEYPPVNIVSGWNFITIPAGRISETYPFIWLVFSSLNVSGVSIFRVYNLALWIKLSTEISSEIYISPQGRPDDTSGTITGTASALIENPSHVIESIARDEIGLTTSGIEVSSFDTAATELTDWKLAFEILDRKKARDITDDISKNIRSKTWWDNYNRLKIKPFDSTRGFAVSGTNRPANLDIFDITGTPVNDCWTTNPIMSPGVTISRVSLDDTYNDFVIKYRKNYATGEYQEVLTMDNGAGVTANVVTNLESADESDMENSQTIAELSALCAESYATYGVTNTLEFECDYIRNRATAVKIMQFLIERCTRRRYQVEFTTKQTAIAKEYGDFINVRTKWTDSDGIDHNGRIEDLFGEATAELKKWEIITRDYNLGTQEIFIKAIEV